MQYKVSEDSFTFWDLLALRTFKVLFQGSYSSPIPNHGFDFDCLKIF